MMTNLTNSKKLLLLLFPMFPTAVLSFLPLNSDSWNRCSPRSSLAGEISTSLLASTSASASTAICDKSNEYITKNNELSSSWLEKGLLLSSFTDGLKSNPNAVDWLMNELVETLWKEEQQNTQLALEESNVASPCNGPDPVLLEQLEDMDRFVEGMNLNCDDTNNNNDWRKNLELLCQMKSRKSVDDDEDDNNSPNLLDLRVLYIPTAMYSLRPGSTSTPGKQRGRNRADGKKRRTEILRLLAGQLETFVDTSCSNNDVLAVRTVTMDFDDGSVKQPEEVMVGDTVSESGAEFPEVCDSIA